MDVVGIILVLICVGLLVAAFIGQLPWGQALKYLAGVGLAALLIYLLVPRLG